MPRKKSRRTYNYVPVQLDSELIRYDVEDLYFAKWSRGRYYKVHVTGHEVDKDPTSRFAVQEDCKTNGKIWHVDKLFYKTEVSTIPKQNNIAVFGEKMGEPVIGLEDGVIQRGTALNSMEA